MKLSPSCPRKYDYDIKSLKLIASTKPKPSIKQTTLEIVIFLASLVLAALLGVLAYSILTGSFQ